LFSKVQQLYLFLKHLIILSLMLNPAIQLNSVNHYVFWILKQILLLKISNKKLIRMTVVKAQMKRRKISLLNVTNTLSINNYLLILLHLMPLLLMRMPLLIKKLSQTMMTNKILSFQKTKTFYSSFNITYKYLCQSLFRIYTCLVLFYCSDLLS
jgi:hypothetical protein